MTERTPFPSLPSTLPIFPLTGVLLLPGGDLPLNIFEPRYLAMIQAALADNRLIGMIQPCPCPEKMKEGARPYYTVGCAGRITEIEETSDGRLLINLHGVSRFYLQSHVLHEDGYRIATVDFDRFKNDLAPSVSMPECMQRSCLVDQLKEYLTKEELYLDWDLAEKVPDQRFFTLLAMVCPFSPAEKQALLEIGTFEERCQLLKSLLELACAEQADLHGELPC